MMKFTKNRSLKFTQLKFTIFLLVILANTFALKAQAIQPKLSVKLLLNLSGSDASIADGFVAVYGDNYSKEIADEDSYKFDNLDENIAINRNGTRLSIEGRPLITAPDTIFINMWKFRQTDYLLKVDGSNFSSAVTAILRDSYLNKDTSLDLTSSTIIPFSISADTASVSNSRFSIIYFYKQPAPPAPPALPVFINVKAYQKDKGIQVEWNTGSETQIVRYELENSVNDKKFDSVAAVLVKTGNDYSHNYLWFDDKASSSSHNYYRIKMVNSNGDFKFSDTVRVDMEIGKRGFAVLPVTEQASSITLTLSNLEEGRYSVNIYNTAGQIVYSGQIENVSGSGLQTLLLTKRLAKGSYIIQMIKNNIRTSQMIVVL